MIPPQTQTPIERPQPCVGGTPSTDRQVEVFASCLTSLEPLETNPQQQRPTINYHKGGNPEYEVRPTTLPEETFRHSSWKFRRAKIWEAFKHCGIGTNRMASFANCGAGVHILKKQGTSEFRLAAQKCKDRFCEACGREEASVIAGNIINHCKSSLFITLTLRHSETPLKDQLKRLYSSFTKLRRRDIFKPIKGGAAFCELKLSEKTGLWHPHLHVIADGAYVEAKALSAAWYAVTGDSYIVDIRRIKDEAHASKYVAKYVTKPCDHTVYANPARLQEMIVSLRGARLCLTFGSWRGLKLRQREKPEGEWHVVWTAHTALIPSDRLTERDIAWILEQWPSLASLIPKEIQEEMPP